MNNLWVIKEQPEALVTEICAYSKLPELMVRVLISNGLTEKKEISAFLNINPGFLHNPYLLNGMDKAVSRIKKAIFNNEKIAIYGDYDVDGVTSVTLLYLYLSSKGADVSFYIPDRADEGYGINCGAIDKLAEKKVTLLITVDSGITASDEIDYAAKKGMEVIVTDHHECNNELPHCVAVINPKIKGSGYPFQGLAGVGVAFKLVCAIEGEEQTTTLLNNYGDLVALGTVADVMPLIDENRIIVSVGLSKFNKRQIRLGLRALLYAAGIEKTKPVTTVTIGYVLAPRINAAGRLGSAESAVNLLTEDRPPESLALAEHLCEENSKRQQTENTIFLEALELFEKTVDLSKDSVAVLCKEGWHHGIIGIVASKIIEKMNMPVILISIENGEGKGSGRSIKGFNLFEALENCKDLLLRFGGHELAAGLTLPEKNIEEFIRKINEFAKSHIAEEMKIPKIYSECAFDIDSVSLEDINTLKRLEPFGISNPMPVFYGENLILTNVSPVSEGKHTRLSIKGKTNELTAIWFGKKFDEFLFTCGQNIDIMCNIDVNDFKGFCKLQLIIKDMRLHK